jgi:alanine-synthesizing transaminase
VRVTHCRPPIVDVFSTRCPHDLEPNRLSRAFDEARKSGRPILDLTQSNPTRAHLSYPDDLMRGLSHPSALIYEPAPFGTLEARRAVASDYARRGLTVPVEHVVLTASSSESYSQLFKLLADPGDDVLVPRPSYPLFDHLARLEGVRARAYDLEYHGRWSVDVAGMERALTSGTRAILAVSPNNPTGSFVRSNELDEIAAVASRGGLAVIVDEVFADYEIEPGAGAAAARPSDRTDVLTFSLGGLSKSVGLPQVKLGWIAASGPADVVTRALERLELICDTYLSVSTPIQGAAASLLDKGAVVRSAIVDRIRANHRSLVDRVALAPSCEALRTEGGWYAIVRVPAIRSEEETAVELARQHGVLVYPGHFFDFHAEAFFVLSLLPEPEVFVEGINRLLQVATGGESPSGGSRREGQHE